MRCLTRGEAEKWFGAMGIQIAEDDNLLLPNRPGNIMTAMPQEIGGLTFLSARLINWLGGRASRMIWISDWQTFPFELVPFIKIRTGCGETRTLLEAPGHLFEDSTEEEDAVMSGLAFLVMAFNWTAYLVTANRQDYVCLGDEYLIFSSSDNGKMKEALAMITEYKLKVIDNAREAWK